MTFGQLLKTHRKRLGLTQLELAEQLSLSPMSIYHIEADKQFRVSEQLLDFVNKYFSEQEIDSMERTNSSVEKIQQGYVRDLPADAVMHTFTHVSSGARSLTGALSPEQLDTQFFLFGYQSVPECELGPDEVLFRNTSLNKKWLIHSFYPADFFDNSFSSVFQRTCRFAAKLGVNKLSFLFNDSDFPHYRERQHLLNRFDSPQFEIIAAAESVSSERYHKQENLLDILGVHISRDIHFDISLLEYDALYNRVICEEHLLLMTDGRGLYDFIDGKLTPSSSEAMSRWFLSFSGLF